MRLFDELVMLCKNKKINLVIVVTPASKYYRDNFWTGYKESFYNSLNNVDGGIHLVDLFDDEYFNDEDFNDTDHLSKLGAEKMTSIILNVLQEIDT